jgi:hypothetical protein
MINWELLMDKIRGWRKLTPYQSAELIVLLHRDSPDELLAEVANWGDLYAAPGPDLFKIEFYATQTEVAIVGLKNRLGSRREKIDSSGEYKKFLGTVKASESVLLTIMRTSTDPKNGIGNTLADNIGELLSGLIKIKYIPQDGNIRSEFVTLSRKLAKRLLAIKDKGQIKSSENAIKSLNRWADYLESGVIPEESDLSSSNKRIR